MKKPWFIVPIILAIIAFFIGRSLSQKNDSSARASNADPSPPAAASPYSHTADTFESSQSPSSSLETLPIAAISTERILRFKDQDAYDSFLAQLPQNGLTLLAQNEHFLSARVSTPHRNALQTLEALAKGVAEIEPNVSVTLPPAAKQETAQSDYLPFLMHAKAWLGAPEDTSLWGKDVTIAILDTGVDSPNAIAIDILDSANTDSMHGTAVASVIARSDEFALAPAAELLSIRVLDAEGVGDTFTLAAGIIEAVDRGAQIINMSLGTPGYSPLLAEAVAYAQSKGVAIVAAAGNDSLDSISYPAALEGVIGVGAIDANAQVMDFSNTGQGIDIVAPGYGVEASFEPSEEPSFISGTSIATPFVSATIAGLLSTHPNLTPTQAAQLVLQNSNDIGAPGDDLTTGQGSLDIDRILKRDTPDLYDAAISDFYLDFENATEHMIPVMITIENRGTEKLAGVNMSLAIEGGNQQAIYLGDIQKNDTTAHTLYVDRYKFSTESGFSLSAKTEIATEDDRPYNDQKEAILTLEP